MKKEKKTRAPRPKKVKVDLSTLPFAVVDGKWRVRVKGQVVFERTLHGKTNLHEGEVFSVDEDGTVTLWDETRGQMFSFKATDPVVIRARFEEDVIKEEASENS